MDTPNTKAAANEPAPWGRTGTKALSLSLYFLLLMGFLLLRLVLVRAPLNSDDNNYLYLSRYLLTGEHAVFRSTLPEALSLQALRFGLLIPTAASIKLFGYNSIAYYLPPFVFSLAGCFLIISISRRFLPWLGVAAVVVMHTVLPFETRHSSLLLTDLPAAVMLLGYFVYLDKYSS